MELNLEEKANKAAEILFKLQPVLIAVSGGIDSRVLAALAERKGLVFAGLFFAGPQVSAAEKEFAFQILGELKRPFYVLRDYPFKGRYSVFDQKNRCYFCKKYLFTQAWQIALKHGYKSVAEGSNASDRTAHRPGKKALCELKVVSPLDLAGFKKHELRALAVKLNLVYPEQASRPCLLTRFPYGYVPGLREIYRLGQAEDMISKLGLTQFRLRIISKDNLLLQVDHLEKLLCSRLMDKVTFKLNELGFVIQNICITDNVSGFFDQKTHKSHKL